ncbi:hypothetical protein CCH79_00015224 [Gambusia affinis]|uniref:Dedicator of cytokinesis N-terminal domain-containing protein n=1 Tax=Gambusia affinis TaxID=33528 RepID=A0A315VS98_GAMAF|nr:hypothetical protein CCH79_00015224 [Gambusia affinis]
MHKSSHYAAGRSCLSSKNKENFTSSSCSAQTSCWNAARWERWYRGFVLKNPNVKGIFPCSYIHLKNAVVKNKGQFETVIPVEDSVITEMTSTLREWGAMWKQLYVLSFPSFSFLSITLDLPQKNEGDLFHRLWHVMNEILDLRRQVLVGHLTHDRMKDVKQHITARLDWGNEQLCLDLVPRREFSMVDPDEISVTELYRLVWADFLGFP